MILLPLTPTVSVLREKAAYKGISLENGLSLVRELTVRQRYLEALDLVEQLYREYPQEAIRILAWTYDLIYRILREKKSRYWLYQARYFDFQIQPEDKVLDIGSGHMPFPFATHLADYAIEDSRYGRAGEPFEHVAGKPIIQCNIEKMPFADREFDFVYCSHVLEHTENPETACRELMRVAKRGYIEMPTKGKDIFFDTARVSRHRWSADILNHCLVLTEYCPEELKGLECDVLGRMVYAPKTEEEKAFYALQFLKADVLNVMLYWEESFAYEVRRISEPTTQPASSLPVVSASSEILLPPPASAPRFSFVMIVLNGMPFIQYSLKSIYDFAHEIIIVEGAVEKCMFAANPDGSSKDGTVEFLRQFPDPARKIRLIQGRWPEKCEMQNEALRYVTGDYVWLIDSDEVYKREHLEKIKEILLQDPSITQVNFIFDNFWKGLSYLFVSEKFFEPACHCRRVFRYKPGAVFTSHRPPTLQWPGSTQTTEQMRLLDGHTTRRMGIIPFHYSYVTKEQVRQKIELYRRYGWGQMWNLNLEDWYEQCFLKWTPANRREIESRWPVWTGDPNSHTEPFIGTHPEVMNDFLLKSKSPSAEAADFLRLESDQQEPKNHLKVAEEYVKNGMMIQENSAFAEAIGQVIREYRPKKILETGTYLGQGTTAVIAEAMKQNGIDGTFFTIEVNPRYHAQAKAYLESRGYPVQALCGLSIPRRLLPSCEQIQQATTAVQDESLFVDHPEPVRVQRYYQETDFPDVPDDLLGKCLADFDGRPDLVLLDSAGHLGWIEFQYLLERLKGPCILALDDINHIKHHRSFQHMQKDSRFEILVSSNEKFGFCIARFDPQRRSCPQPHPLEPKHILWLRPDAIGDGILSLAMLPRIRRRFPSARLTVFVQQAVAPLYETCPFVDEILCFQPEETNDPVQFLRRWSQRIWTLKADCLLHSVYSRQFLMDGLAYASGIPERIGIEGDCCNIHPEEKAKSDGWYTWLIPSEGDWKPELERHRDFLRGLGCDDQPLKPVVWLTPEDEAYAHKWLEENQINPKQLVVLFAGARVSLRHYEGYGKALEETALKHRLAVAALGAKEDFEINQRNLDWLKERGIRTFNLCGRLSLRQSAAILKQCRLAVGAETGLAHLAAAVDVPHVVVIGGGHFGRFMPYSPKTTLAALPLDCYGCNWLCRYEQERNYCIQDLQPAVLSEAIRETFEKSSSKPRIFIQDQPLYKKPESGPAWKLFSKFIDTSAVEICRVSHPQKDSQTHAPSLPAVPAVLRSKEHLPAGAFPKITVVTPSYNQAPYLEECIQSVLSQGYPNLEYIIMDGGSTDGSVEIIKKYEKYLTYWQSKPDGGQYAAVEEGFRRSTGEILTWINSDDMLLPGALRKVAAIFLNRPDVQWITGKVCLLEADGTIHYAALAPVFWNRARYLAKDYKYIQQEGSFWRRHLWEKAGAFLWKESRLAGDLELWNRFFRHADLYTAEAFLGAFRMQPNRKTASLIEKYNQEAEAVLEAELQQYASQPVHSRPPLRKPPQPITELEISRYLEIFPDQQPSQPVQIPSSGNFLVSAIVSTYNAEAFIRSCLQNLVEQTLFQKGQMEILVVDSGSQQNEGRIVRQFQSCYPNIRYLRTPQREPIYAAWNRAIRLASGKYLTSANTDDRHRPDALEILAETLEKNPKIALVYSDQVIAPIPLERFSARWGQLIPRPDYSYERLLFGCCVGSQPMWRKSLHEEFGLFDETLTVAGDWDFWLRIAARYPFQRVPEFLGVYYNNPASAEHGRPIHSLYERYLVGKRYGNPHISIIPPCVRKDNPLVSVILPVYNGADYIAEAIESVLIQNYPHLELLIINDGSEDNTEEIVKRFSDERIRYFLQNHGGPSAARNEGIRRSKGQFLVMLDHDDYLTADHIGQMLTAYDRYPEADLIYCDTLLLNEEGKALRVHQRKEFQNPNYLIQEIFQAGFPIVPFRTCIRRRVFEKIGEYDPSLWVAEDYDMWRRFLKQGLIFRHWPKSYYCRRIRRNAHSRIITPEKARMHFQVLQRYLETFEPQQLFPDVRWDSYTGFQKEFLFHLRVCGVFVALGEQYKETKMSACLVQLACEQAVRHLEICRSIYPEQPAIVSLEQRCQALFTDSEPTNVLQESVSG